MASLRISYPNGRHTVVELTGGEAVIGRDSTCDVPLDDAITSRRHAKLYKDPAGQYWIKDLQSKNSTLVNDKAITTSRVRPNDRIGIGACFMTLTPDTQPEVILSDAANETQCSARSAWGAESRLDLPRRRLEKLYELNARLTGRFSRDDLMGEVLEICRELLRFERCGVAVWSGAPNPPQWVKLLNHRDDSEFRISRSLVDRALNNAERTLINDTADGEIDPTASMISNNIRSAMCVPMEYLQEVRGVLYGDRVSSTGGYKKEDIDFFAALGRLAAMGLANVRLLEEMQERQRVDMQIQWARGIQAQLFPAEPLAGPGMIIDALNDPGQKVSGDYFDYFLRPDGLVTIVMADVSGKGIPASLLMANLQAGVHVTLATETDIVAGVDRLNKLICHNVSGGRFITAIFGLFDPEAKTFQFVNTGHLGPYLLRSGGRVQKLNPEPGLPLGIDPDFSYHAETIELSATPVTLLLYTDGIPEAENDVGEQYEEHRLAAALEGNTNQPPGELITRLRRSVKQFTRNHPQSDDITILALRLD